MEPPLIDVATLGVLQGITEFFPVSLRGHLALADFLFGIREADATVNLLLQAGTLLALLLVLRSRLFAIVRGAPAEGAAGEGNRARDLTAIALASVPTAALALGLRGIVRSIDDSPLAVGVGLLATSAVLLSTRWVKTNDRENPTAMGALLMGIAQGLAVFPGFSRSGATLALGLWLGLRKERAFELSLLISLPSALAIILLEAPKVTPSGVGVALFGAAIAFALGVFALVALRQVVVHGRLAVFALWVLPLALATLTMARAWPRDRAHALDHRAVGLVMAENASKLQTFTL